MNPPQPSARVAALRKKRKPKVKFNRLANLGTRARKILSDDDVRDIRARWKAGEKLDSIAHDYRVSAPCVSMIGTRQRRAGVKP